MKTITNSRISSLKNRIVRIIRNILLKILYKMNPILSPYKYESIRLFLNLGYWPHIKKPRSLNEKIKYRDLFRPDPLSTVVADKIRVREYVKDKVGAEVLNKVYWTGRNPSEIPFDELPDKFVIKSNRGSGMNLLVTDKSSVNRDNIIEKCGMWLTSRPWVKYHEMHYDSIPSMLMVEEFLIDDQYERLLDFKFFCFHGKIEMIDVINRCGTVSEVYYDSFWNVCDFRYVNIPRGKVIRKPTKYSEMCSVAKSLSADFDFVRIDLFSPNDDSVIFGEITISPTKGSMKFIPKYWDFKLGKLW